jgi:hypothetical protein
MVCSHHTLLRGLARCAFEIKLYENRVGGGLFSKCMLSESIFTSTFDSRQSKNSLRMHRPPPQGSITFQIPECLGYTAECTKRPPKNAPLLIIFVISAGGPACGRRVLTLPPCSCAGAGLPAAPPLLAAAPLMCRPPQPPRAQPPQLTSSSAPAPAARGIRPARHPTSPSCAATTLLSNDGT